METNQGKYKRVAGTQEYKKNDWKKHRVAQWYGLTVVKGVFLRLTVEYMHQTYLFVLLLKV